MKNIKHMLMGTALAVSLTTASMAAECTFSGFYMGTQLGYGSLNNNGKSGKEAFKGTTIGGAGLVGGLHAGYGKQFSNRFYLGLEAYGNLTNQEQKFRFEEGHSYLESKQKKQYSIGLKLRPGIVIGNAMVYGILGADYTRFKQSGEAVGFDLAVHNKTSKNKGYFGFMPGIGVAFNATEHMIIGLELTHTFHEKIKTSSDRTTDGFARISYKF